MVFRFTFLLPALAGVALAQSQSAEFFESRIRPIFANNCYSCHAQSKLGGFRLDSRAAILEGGKSGPAIVSGHPEQSILIRAVERTDPKLSMPLGGSKLKDSEIQDLKDWIAAGAPWPEVKQSETQPAATKHFTIRPDQRAFWSFQPIGKPTPPAVKDANWVKTPIDNFILAKLEEKGIRPVAFADKTTLIRRATYDLTGLPPTPEQIEAFVADQSPDAFAKVIDRLLASPQYGERWGRHWLDVARYGDGDAKKDARPVFIGYGMARDGYANTWRYRDWVIDAINHDMPYDLFAKAQIAGDLLPNLDHAKLLPALGFFGLGPWFTGDDVVFVEARANERDDKIDALTKGFLGLTVTCARCHDHKYDPISQKDYYALGGVFASSGYYEYNLAPDDVVARYRDQQKKITDQQAAISDFVDSSAIDIARKLAGQSVTYMMAARKVALSSPALDAGQFARDQNLDAETLGRWIKYLAEKDRQHPFLRRWDALMKEKSADAEAQAEAQHFQEIILSAIDAKKEALAANREMVKSYKPDPNEARAQLPGDLMQFELFQYKQQLVQKVVETNKFYVWLDIVQGEPSSPDYPKKTAVLEYHNQELLRFFTPEQKQQLESMKAELAALVKACPAEYPYLMGIRDEERPVNLKLNLRGNAHALGDEVPRGFPAILAGTNGDPLPFTHGSGRLELAERIVQHPLFARVMANRIWMNHFGRGIVDSPSNFGVMGDRPSHPELLDYLASRFQENHWSMKAMHREIMLSSVYQLSAAVSKADADVDPENRLLWRANLRRLDIESLRDSMLFVAGNLDERVGGPPQDLNDPNDKKRTVYGRVSRNAPNRLLLLFDFPDPNISGDQRSVTNVPLQGLFFMNSDFVWTEAGLFASRIKGDESSSDAERIAAAYRFLYGRKPTDIETKRGLEFLSEAGKESGRDSAWQQYAQVLLSSGESIYVD